MPKNIFEKLKDLFTTQNTKLTSIATKLEELEIGRGGGVGQVDATPGATYHGEIFNQYTGVDTNQATGMNTHAEGYSTIASGHFSHAEGQNTEASGAFSHAEGQNTTATKDGAHAEGVMQLENGHMPKDSTQLHLEITLIQKESLLQHHLTHVMLKDGKQLRMEHIVMPKV